MTSPISDFIERALRAAREVNDRAERMALDLERSVQLLKNKEPPDGDDDD